jgi:L-malate glycosyltransferase
LRILHLNTERTWRGGETQLLLLARGLKTRGHEQWVVGQPGSPLLERAGADGLEVFGIPMPSEFSPSAIWKLSRLFHRLKIQAVHMHTPRACTLGGIAARISKVKVKVISRRVDFTLRYNPLRKLKYGWGIDRIIAVSGAIRGVLIQDGMDPDRIEVIHSGVGLSRFDPDLSGDTFRKEMGIGPETSVIGNIAHFADHKGHRYLVEAAGEVIRHRPGARFVLVGDGELKKTIESQVRGLGLENNVVFTGFRTDIPSILAAFDLFVLSSHLEGLCTSLMDAMAMGKPVVATTAGGIPEVVEDGVTGLLVPPKNPPALAEAMIRMIEDADLRRKFGEAGRRRAVEQFGDEAMVVKTETLYQTILKSKGERTA